MLPAQVAIYRKSFGPYSSFLSLCSKAYKNLSMVAALTLATAEPLSARAKPACLEATCQAKQERCSDLNKKPLLKKQWFFV